LSLELVWKTLRTWNRLIIAVALLIGAYAAAGFFLVPYLARVNIERYITQDLKRHVTIGNIAFNPFTLAAEVRSFALCEADYSPIASFSFFRIDFQLSSLIYRAWTFSEVRLERPNIQAILDENGSLNHGKLRAPHADNPKADTTIHIPAMRITTLAVHGGRIVFEDHTRTRKEPFTSAITPIEFTLNNFRTQPNYQNLYNFEGTTLAGEHLTWSGEFTVQPTGSIGEFKMENLKVSTIAGYLGDALKFDLRSGVLDLHGRYRIELTDKVHFGIELPSLKLSDVNVAPANSPNVDPWIRLPSLEVTDSTMTVENRSVKIGRIQVNRPSVTAWREADGRLNLSQLVADSAAPHANAPANGSFFDGWNFGVGTIAVQEATLDAEDRTETPAAKLQLAPVSLSLSGYSNAPGAVMKADADIGAGARGRIKAQGDITLSPLAANAEVNIADFDLQPLQTYLTENRPVHMKSGELSLKGTLRMRDTPAKNEPRMRFDGDMSIANLATIDSHSNLDFVKWKLLKFSPIHYAQSPDRLEVERVEALQPYGRFLIDSEKRLNIVTILSFGSRPSATPSPEGTAPMPVIIRSIVVHDGTADFSDFSIEPNFSASIFGLEGDINGLSSDLNSRANLKLSGNVDRYSPVEISGQVNLLSAALYSDLRIKFQNMELTTFNPYSGKYAGYSIRKGKLTTDLQYKVENRKLDAKHHVVLDQLEFGAATESKDKVPIPMKLAASLLKDRHGVIDLNIPVTGSIDDPEFRLWPLIWKALKGLLDKIVTAPFKLLGSLFGKGEELAYVDFEPGSATLSPAQQEKVATLSKALLERPQLRLDVPLRGFTPADDDALSHKAFEDALAAFLPPASPGVAVTREQQLAAMTQLYEKQMNAPPEFTPPGADNADVVAVHLAFLENALRPTFRATPTQWEQLARARADAIQAGVLDGGQVDPERVFLTERESGKSSSPEIVRLELQLE